QHDAIVVVKDAEPMCRRAVAAVTHSAPQSPLAENLISVVKVVNSMKNRVLIADLDNRPVREYELHALFEPPIFLGSPEIVEHQKSAAQQVFPQRVGLRLGEFPIAHFAGAQPRPVVDIVAVVEVYRLFHGPHVKTREAAEGQYEMAVGAWI